MAGIEGQTIILAPQFLADTTYYAAILGANRVVIDTSMAFDKRFKSTHRTEIADANGKSMLTVPIEKPRSMSRARWSDIVVSAHGGWWNVVMTALRSAYGRTPFCEYYIDDFEDIINSTAAGKPLMDLCTELDRLMRRLMLIDTPVEYGAPTDDLLRGENCKDFRRRELPIKNDVAYYQVRQGRHGFIGGLSAVDLLFNMGPESVIILKKMAE